MQFLSDKLASSAFPEVLTYIKNLTPHQDKLPRIIPVALIQEPIVVNGKPQGFPGKKVIFGGENPRAAIVTLKNVDIVLQQRASNRDVTCALLCSKVSKLLVTSFYSDISEQSPPFDLNLIRDTAHTMLLSGDSNAHSTLWGNLSNNRRGDIWEELIARENLTLLNNTDEHTFSNHLGSSCIDITLSNDTFKFNNWLNTGSISGSDHSLLICSSAHSNALTDKKMQNIANTNWPLFKSSLAPIIDSEINSTEALNSRASSFTNNIIAAFNVACPPKTAFPNRPCKWWNKNLSNILRRKNLAAWQAKKFHGRDKGRRATLAKKALAKTFPKNNETGKRL